MFNTTENKKQEMKSRFLSGKKLIIIVCATLSTGAFAQTSKIIKTSKDVSRKTNEVNQTAHNAKSAIEDTKEAIDASKMLLTAVFWNKKKKETTGQNSNVKTVANEADKTTEAVINTTATELFELVKIFAPDANAVTGNWQTAAPAIKWKNAQPILQSKNYVRNGEASVIINGKAAMCMNALEGMEIPCAWNVTLTGTKAGYIRWEVFANDYQVADQTQATKELFPKAGMQLKVLKKFDEGVTEWFYVYEVTVPGKKVFYMRVEYSSGTATAAQAQNVGHDSFSVTCFLNKSEAIQ